MGKKKSGFFGARGARSRVVRTSSGLQTVAVPKVYHGIDMDKFNKKYAPKWEDVHSVYEDLKSMVFSAANELSTRTQGPRWDAASKLAAPGLSATVQYRIAQIDRDTQLWSDIVEDMFEGAKGKTGPIDMVDYEWFVQLKPKMDNIVDGYRNTMVPIINEIETLITVMNYDILGVTPAEFEVLPNQAQQELVLATYGRRVAEYNLANPDNQIDPSVVMLPKHQASALGLIDVAEVTR